MTAPVSLSVVIPAFNEEKRLPGTLARVLPFLRSRGETFEVVVVDDGSKDRTAEVARTAGPEVRVLQNPGNRGKGYSVRNGMLNATGAWRLMCDADLSTPIEDLDTLKAALGGDAQIAIASRAVADANVEKHQSIARESSGRFFNLLVRVLHLSGIKDTQCGFKLFSAAAAEAAFRNSRLDGFAFDVEALVLAKRAGFGVREVGVTWRNDEQTRVSLGRGLAAFVDLFRLKFRS
ncbi:MAG: glycosyltransferase family 2 protein [Vicinamibacteria bacterium]|nr:glycosyltransferase family 2 protein [Vicinamibacteria bacterium]